MKVLFIGDSITKGTQGVNWVKKIENSHPLWTIKNAGVKGDTLNKIASKLSTYLPASDPFNVIVFQVGLNDILLPTFKNRNFWYRQIYKRRIKSGNQPADLQEFELLMKKSLQLIHSYSTAHVVLCTLGCLNEDLLSQTNSRLISYNTVIRRLAVEFNCILADPEEPFQTQLKSRKTNNYCLNDFINYDWLDKVRCNFGKADRISKKRNLHLTIDGVHLNDRGAKIFKEEVEKAILLTKEEVLLYI